MHLRSSNPVAAVVAALGIQTAAAHVARASSPDQTCKKTTVAILGGGMAGVTAAQALTNSSISDFIIVEYNDRVGGRVTQKNFGKKDDGSPWVVELGANWVQGLGNPGGPENPVWTLAKKYQLKNHYSNYSAILTYNETGYTDYSALIDEYDDKWNEASVEAGRMLAENVQDESARAGLSLAGWNPKHSDMARQAVEWWSWDWEAALTPEESSLIFGAAGDNLTFNQFSDENNLVIDSRGYRYIIEAESETFLKKNDSRLLLNTQVTNVTYSDDGVTVYNSDGSCISAAYAICTFSLGVLQNEVVTWQPELPDWKQKAIQKFSMGTYTKIFLQFNETFWPEGIEYFLYASPTKRGYYPVWQSISTDGFMPGSNMIFVTVVEDESYRVEQQSDEETQKEVMEVLREMFPNITVPEPTAFMYPRWTKTPWAYGSYSNWPVGTTLEMHQNLRANSSRVWFAGEATSAEYFGFLHGAWFEGRDAALEIASLLNGNCAHSFNGTGPATLCGGRQHYAEIHGTSPLENYNALNGWATSSFYASQAAKKRSLQL